MRLTNSTVCLFAVGSLTLSQALPTGTLSAQCMSPKSTKATSPEAMLLPRQKWNSEPATSVAALTAPQPTFIFEPSQPSVIMPTVSYSYTDVPVATVTSPVQKDETYTAPRDKFGGRAMLASFGVIGAVVMIVLAWAVIAQRNNRRPFACFGGCTGRKDDSEKARQGSADSDLPLFGAGRHYDRRPVSVQPQSFSMPVQRPQPVQHSIPRQSQAEPEWARYF